MKVIAHGNIIHAGAHVSPGQEFDWTGSESELAELRSEGLIGDVGAVPVAVETPVAVVASEPVPLQEDPILLTILADALELDTAETPSFDQMIHLIAGYSGLAEGVIDAVEGITDPAQFRDRMIELAKDMAETLTENIGKNFALQVAVDQTPDDDAAKKAADEAAAKKAAEKEAADKLKAEKAAAAKKAADEAAAKK